MINPSLEFKLREKYKCKNEMYLITVKKVEREEKK